MTNTGSGEPNATGARNYGVGSTVGVNLPGLTQATAQVNQLASSLGTLQAALSKLQNAAPGITNAVSNITKSLNTMSSAGGGGTTYGRSGSTIGGLASSMFGPSSGGIASQVALFPARFMNTQLSNNRNVVNAAGQALGSQAFASGMNLSQILGSLSKQMGGVMGGNPSELLQLMDVARQAGARIDWQGYTGTSQSPWTSNAPRASGFLESVRQGQIISPGTDVGSLAGTFGGFLANTQSQQQGAFLTGGAFSMVGSGNRAKSLSEWAEGLLKWFMNQRPGNMRGKPFNYGELMSQNFPGSNIDAWFSANGVPQDMRDQWWSYALGKASQTGTTGGAPILGQGVAAPKVTEQNPMYQRLQAGNVTTRQSYNIGSQLTGMYGNMEQSNRWFNELLGQMLGTVLPGALSSGGLSWMQYLPDEIRDLLMSAAESTKVGALGAGVLGWGSLFGAGSGDVGDVGDYGSMGTSGMAGMHPDMRKRVGAMMRANPNLSITSGHRDLAKQQTLKRKGVGRVSGRPSAHTRGMAADIGPASQYGWLVKNAGKFGLKSGIGAGEPWHVGMGDVGDFWDDAKAAVGNSGMSTGLDPTAATGIMSMFEGLLSKFGSAFTAGQDPDTQMKGIAGVTSTILKALLSVFASPNANLDNLKFRDVYGSLTKYTQESLSAGVGLPTGGGGGGGGSGGGGGGGAVSPDAVTRAAVVAKAAYDAGFRGNDLFTVVSIAGRESSWNPNVRNLNEATKDDSYGLMQINMRGNLGADRRQRFGIPSDASLFDPYQNMHGAFILSGLRRNEGKDPFYDWGPYKGESPLYNTESKQATAREAIRQANVGDVDFATASTASMGRAGVAVFNNTFKIDGGGGANGGIDVKRAASQIADTLEQQMRQRMSRNN